MKKIASSLLSALFLFLAFPPSDLGGFAWLALVPLFLAIRGAGPVVSAALCGTTGVLFIGGACAWINVIGGVGPAEFLLMALSYGIFTALFGLLHDAATRRTRLPSVVIAPILWVAIEYVRANVGFMSHHWGLLAHSQYRFLPAIQVASIGGPYAVSFLVVLSNATLAEVAQEWADAGGKGKEWYRALMTTVPVPAVLIVATIAWGAWRISSSPPPERTLRIAVVQGNIPQDVRWEPEHRKWILEKHVALSRKAAAESHPSLIVWPETSVPGILTFDPSLQRTLSGLARGTGANLLLGGAQQQKFNPALGAKQPRTNSVVLMNPHGLPIGRYDKIVLIPFGEYLPLRGKFPWPRKLAEGAGHFLAGRKYTVLNVEGVPVSAPICWETFFPDHIRHFVAGGARLLVNVTNEAWFGDTAAPRQFLSMNVFRAVENGVPLVRCANTGISAFVDPYGRVLGRVSHGGKDVFVEGYLTMDVPIPPAGTRTVYTRHGDMFSKGCLGVSGLMALYVAAAPIARRIRRRKVPHDP